MQKKLFQTCVAGAAILWVAFAIHGCKKDTAPSDVERNEQQIEKQGLKTYIETHGTSVIVPVNEKVNAFYADADGNPITKAQLQRHTQVNSIQTNTITSACDYSNSPTATLNSYTMTFNCTQGLSVSWNYTVSSNNNLTTTNGAQVSKGKFYIYNSSNTLIYSNASITPATITDLGVDGSNPGYELFSVTFATGWLPSSDYNFTYYTKWRDTCY